MEEYGEFLVLRYSLIEESQRIFKIEPLPTPKGEAVKIALEGDPEYTRNNVRYAFVGFSLIVPSDAYSFPPSRYMVGKVAKLRKARVGEKIPGDIIEHEEDDWIPLVAVFDFQNQFIFVQRNWNFGTEQQIVRSIETGLRGPVLAKYNHRVFVEAKTQKEDFWRIVENHEKIYRLELKLISPNIMDTNRKASEALDALKKLYKQEEVSVTLENKSGLLEIPRKPVEDYVDYIAEGEGNWGLVTEGERGGKKKYRSENCAMSLDFPVVSEEELYSEGQLEIKTGVPAPDRGSKDVRLVAKVHSESEMLGRKKKDE